ncbi:MAG: WGR domain-containing protein [Polyangiaceae bacterium]
MSGTTFVVEYGRLGTNGQRKEKDFGNEAAARRELEKKIAEKLREGYSEVRTDGGAAAPKGAKGAQAASAKLDLPPRIAVAEGAPAEAAVLASVSALSQLAGSVGRRSFVTAQAFKRARRALRALGGAEVSGFPALSGELERVLELSVREKGPRLSVGRCMELLSELPTGAFERAMEIWGAAKGARPAWSMGGFAGEVEALGDAELAFRLGALLLSRPGRAMASEAGWQKRMAALMPHLQAHLVRRGSSPKKHLGAMDARGDAFLAARISEAARAAGG